MVHVAFNARAYLHVKVSEDDHGSSVRVDATVSPHTDGHRYLDGGTTDSPFMAALALPDGKAERAVDVPDHAPAKSAGHCHAGQEL